MAKSTTLPCPRNQAGRVLPYSWQISQSFDICALITKTREKPFCTMQYGSVDLNVFNDDVELLIGNLLTDLLEAAPMDVNTPSTKGMHGVRKLRIILLMLGIITFFIQKGRLFNKEDNSEAIEANITTLKQQRTFYDGHLSHNVQRSAEMDNSSNRSLNESFQQKACCTIYPETKMSKKLQNPSLKYLNNFIKDETSQGELLGFTFVKRDSTGRVFIFHKALVFYPCLVQAWLFCISLFSQHQNEPSTSFSFIRRSPFIKKSLRYKLFGNNEFFGMFFYLHGNRSGFDVPSRNRQNFTLLDSISTQRLVKQLTKHSNRLVAVSIQNFASSTSEWLHQNKLKKSLLKDKKDGIHALQITSQENKILNVFPLFDSKWLFYELTVKFEEYIVFTSFEFKNGTMSHSLEFPVGLGENTLYLAGDGLTYQISIKRFGREDTKPNMTILNGMEVCYIFQTCDWLIDQKFNCGMQRSNYANWSVFVDILRKRKSCGLEIDGHDGRWYLPCQSCTDERSCSWSNATWIENGCQFKELEKEVQRCLANKTVLFLGDSTLRGMVHRIIQMANKTLATDEKLHEYHIFRNVNENRTFIAFNYYPIFWKKQNTQKSFMEALRLLFRFNRKVTVVIKLYGAGFHIGNFSRNFVIQHRTKMSVMNRNLRQKAKEKGFLTIDSFRMTTARNKEFYPGQCACHFHEVLSVSRKVSLDFHEVNYEVVGDINNFYTNILLNKICTRV
ncbi:cadherin-like and PC-esterase domain-containing protein 1 [Artemia franciscana]